MKKPAGSSTVEELLDTARARLRRLDPPAAARAHAAGALLVDIRPVEVRRRDGEVPGAVVVDRNVLEWRLDPTSRYRLREMTSHARRILPLHQGSAASRSHAAGSRLTPPMSADRRLEGCTW